MMQPDTNTDITGVSLTAGSDFTVTDANGTAVYSGTAVCNAGYVFYSSAALSTDAAYTLQTESASVESTAQTGTSGSGMAGGMGGQRPNDGGQQNTDALPPEDKQNQPA